MVGYCINLLNREKRFLETRNALSKTGIDLIRFGVDIELSPGIKKFNINPGDMCNSILNSHLKLYKHLKSINNKYHLILEDDVIVLNNIDIENLIESAPNDWDVIYLGGVNHFFKPDVHSSKFYKCKYTFNPHAYIVKSSFLETLINRVEIRDFQLDVIFAKMQSEEIGNWYCTTKDYIIQHGKYSDTTITTFGDDYFKIQKLGGKINLKELGPKIRRNLKQISKIEIFQDICKKQLEFIENKYPKIDKKSKLKSLIVESRTGDYIEFIIKNTIQKLGDGWGHIIVCTNENYNEIKRISSVISNEIEIINLGDFKITRNSYNNLCLDINFWNQINCEKVFVYQSDTYIFKEFDKKFLQPDYIGAPWGEHGIRVKEIYNLEKNILLGNGGLSLRTMEAIKWVLQNHKPVENHEENMDYIFEDLYFSYHIEMSDKWKLADLELAESFSFEHIFYEDTFGCHQPYCDSFHQDDLFERFLDKFNVNQPLLSHLSKLINDGKNQNRLDENIDYVKTRKIFLFYHVYCENDWEEIFNEQINLIYSCGLFEDLDKIFINIIGDESYLEKVQTITNNKKFVYSIIPNEYEFPTLDKIIEVSKQEYFYGVYIHSKSSSYPINHENKYILSFWKNFMNYQILKNWQICYEKIKDNDLVGTLYKDGNVNIDEYWNKHSRIERSSSSKYTNHFSGNFYWFDSNYFKKIELLDKNQKLNRFNAEWLCFKNNPKFYTIYNNIGFWEDEFKKLSNI